MLQADMEEVLMFYVNTVLVFYRKGSVCKSVAAAVIYEGVIAAPDSLERRYLQDVYLQDL